MISRKMPKILVLLFLCAASTRAQVPGIPMSPFDSPANGRAIINNAFTFLASTKTARWSGSGAPGSIPLSLLGDLYFDTVGQHTYACYSVLCSSAPTWVRVDGGGVTSAVNDTNVTGVIAGSVLTLGWTGTLAAGRLNSNVVQAIVNDTNVTGSISAQTLTLNWTGTLAKTRTLATTIYTDQANTLGAFPWDASAA